MADKKYKLKFHLSNGTVKEVEFVAPQGPQGDPFTYADFTQEQLAALKGPDGKSAYEYAQEAGFEGSEEEFAKALFSGSGFQVGDILTTVRTDLGEKWLLCNGEQVSANDYSELVDLLPVLPADWVASDLGTLLTIINCITYANGYWVVGGYYSNYARIAYTTDPTGTWTTKDLWSGINNDQNTINCITYADGKWVVGGQCYSGGYYARIAYATDLTGTWTTKDLWSGNSAYTSINCITYADGKWVVGGRCYSSSSYYARIAYATDLTGTWTTKDLWSGTKLNNIINCITYADGKWVVGGQCYSSSYYARIAYATDLTGTWTTNDWSNKLTIINCITYANGYWVVGGYYSNYARIAYTTDPTGTWTTKDLWSGNSDNSISCIAYAKGYWVVGGKYYDGSTYYARIAYATDPTGTWTTKDLWSGNSAYTSINCITYADGKWVVGGYYGGPRIAYTASQIFVLPTISTGGAYNYIKALEG